MDLLRHTILLRSEAWSVLSAVVPTGGTAVAVTGQFKGEHTQRPGRPSGAVITAARSSSLAAFECCCLALLQDNIAWHCTLVRIDPSVAVIAGQGAALCPLFAFGDVSAVADLLTIQAPLRPCSPLLAIIASAWLPLDAVGESSVGALACGGISQTVTAIPLRPCWAVITGALSSLHAMGVGGAVAGAAAGDAVTGRPTTPIVACITT
jgi:hypothetical protein